MTIKIRELPPFIISLFLHLLVFVGMSILAMKPEVLAPFGAYKKGGPVVVEFESLPSPKAVVQRVNKPRLHHDGEVAVEKQKAKPIEQNDTPAGVVGAKNLGHADGNLTSGPLGEANGSRTASVKERYLYELRVLIEGRKVYPTTSMRLRETGRVLVAFTIEKDGTISAVEIKQGASFARLNEAAKNLISGIGKYKPLPSEFNDASTNLEIPIEYSLQ